VDTHCSRPADAVSCGVRKRPRRRDKEVERGGGLLARTDNVVLAKFSYYEHSVYARAAKSKQAEMPWKSVRSRKRQPGSNSQLDNQGRTWISFCAGEGTPNLHAAKRWDEPAFGREQKGQHAARQAKRFIPRIEDEHDAAP